jgi:hypothetical protein
MAVAQNSVPPLKDWPLYWFAALEKARESGDQLAADHAQQELHRLGVYVAFAPRPAQPKAVQHAAS